MTLGAVVQARMRSTRLPGKVLREVGGKAIIEHLLQRLARARSLDLIVVATSDDPSDDALATRCERLGVTVHRGPLDDVAGRFAEVIERFALDPFVRVSGDSPLLDPSLVDRVVAALDTSVDVATNVHPRTFPRGQSVEVVRADAFRRALALMDAPGDREHVTPAIYRHADRFRIRSVRSDDDQSAVRMAIDDREDLERLERAFARMSRPAVGYGLEELVSIYREVSAPAPSR